VLWSEKSVKQLKKLDKKTAKTIHDRVLELEDDSYKIVSRLASSKFYKIHVGNYRIILDIQQGKLIIFVIETDHRNYIYD
jgi:mRNA interferase RelE/StbE